MSEDKSKKGSEQQVKPAESTEPIVQMPIKLPEPRKDTMEKIDSGGNLKKVE